MAEDLNYGIGVEGKNLVLKTLGRVYIKVKDRKYELAFRPEDTQNVNTQSESGNDSSNLVFINSSTDINSLTYPGDNKLIISRDGHLYLSENNGYTEIVITFTGKELSLENLNISGQIVFTENNVPLVISNNSLIQNLNADLLDNYQASDFAIKSLTQDISGAWTYTGEQTFNTIIGQQKIIDNANGQRINIDFKTGTIKCNTLSASKITTSEETPQFSTVSGIGQEVWVGVQIEILETTNIENQEELDDNSFYIVEDAYENEELPNYSSSDDTTTEWTLEDFWYPLFFETWDTENLTYTLRDFSNPDVWNTQNAKFDGTDYSLNNFQNIIDGLRTDVDTSSFTGEYYLLSLPDNTPIMSLVPHMVIKDNLGNIARIVSRDSASVNVQTLNSNNEFYGDRLIVIGSLCRQGGIKLSSEDPSLSILKNVLDETSASVYFGNLTKIDSSKTGIGMILSGTYPTTLVADNTMDNLQNYIHTSEINIENPYLKWGDSITAFNEDGSGYLSKGQIRWSSNNDLIIDNTDITNSSFKNGNVLINRDGSGNIGDVIQFNSTAVTLNSPLGPAGGDLEGNYPNPTLAQAYIDRIIYLEKTVQDLESRVSALEPKKKKKSNFNWNNCCFIIYFSGWMDSIF